MEGHIFGGQRGAVVILGDSKMFLVYVTRDRKHAGRRKKQKNVQVIRAGGLHFPPHRHFFISRSSHASVAVQVVFHGASDLDQ